MLSPWKVCLGSLHKFATKALESLNKLKYYFKGRKPKRLCSRDLKFSASSFAALGESAQLKQVFDFFDANGDGKISPPELRRVLLKLGREESAAAEEAEGMVREMDRDGDGLVDVDEFMSVVSGGNGSDGSCGGREEDLKDAFLVFDYDGNGFISAGELQRVLLSLGHRDCSLRKCQKMIKGVDRDGNGLVDFEEFRWMMTGGRCKS